MVFESNDQSQFVRSVFARMAGLALGIVAGSLLAASASAEQGNGIGVNSTVVSYADLNLSRQQDAEKLYVRLQRASERVCGHPETRMLSMKRRRDRCYRAALTDAVVKVDQATVTALHAAEARIRLARGS